MNEQSKYSLRPLIIATSNLIVVVLLVLILLSYLITIDQKLLIEEYIKLLPSDIITHPLSPEPEEFILYISSCILIVLIPLFFVYLRDSRYLFSTDTNLEKMSYRLSEGLLLVAFSIIFVSFFFTSKINSLIFKTQDPSYTEIVFTPVMGSLLVYSIILLPIFYMAIISIKKNIKFKIIIFLESFLYLIVFLIFLVSEYENSDKYHFAFFIDSIVFINKGMLFSDMNVPLYGLYSLFLLPIFSLIELSVLNVGIIVSLLNILVIFLISQSMRKIFDGNNYVVLLTLLSIIFFTLILNRILQSSDWNHYYQYFPLRVLFPALCIYFFIVFDKFLYSRFFISVFFLSFGIFWNFESGLIALLTFAISEIFKSIYMDRFKEIVPKTLILSIASFLSFITGYYIFSPYFSDSFFNFLIPTLTYGKLGLYMHPMRLFGEQLLILLPYYASVVVPILFINNAKKNERLVYYFFFGVLGLGTFSYFVGRSFGQNIYGVMYPFIILCVLYFYDFIKNFKFFKDYLITNLAFITSSFFIFIPILIYSFSFKTDLITKHTIRGYKYLVREDPLPNSQLYEFINSHTSKDEPVLVDLNVDTHEVYINTHITIPESFVYKYHINLKSQEEIYKLSFKKKLHNKIIVTKDIFAELPYKENYIIIESFGNIVLLESI